MPDLNQLLGTLLSALSGINQPLETLLGGLEADLVTSGFLWLLLAIFVLAIVYKMRGRHPRFTAYAPTLLTSLGIFGTFVGIVIGLVDFDPNQIDRSVSDLLEGLKTAFASSIAGLGSGLFFRFLTTTSLFPESEGGDEEIDISQRILVALNKQTQLLEATQKAIAGDEGSSLIRQVRWLREEHRAAHQAFTNRLWQEFAAQMQLLEATQKAITGDEGSSLSRQVMLLREEHRHAHEEFTDQLWQKFAAQTQLLEAIQKVIAGTEESSLAEQVKLLREEHGRAHQEFRDQLWRKLDEFAEMMSRSASEQVIEALKEVIADFNQNLTEQFGDNFKKLNASVEKLVVWQENYRKQLEELHNLYEESVAAITLIEQRCALIPQSMDKLEPIIETANHQIAELKRHLAAFAEMRDRANEAMSEVSKFSDEMHKAVTKIIEDMATQLGKISIQFARDYEQHIKAMADVIKQAKAFNQGRGDNR